MYNFVSQYLIIWRIVSGGSVPTWPPLHIHQSQLATWRVVHKIVYFMCPLNYSINVESLVKCEKRKLFTLAGTYNRIVSPK